MISVSADADRVMTPLSQKYLRPLAFLLLVPGHSVEAQRPTIPESVERMRSALCRNGACDPYVTSRTRELAPFPFERAVRDSDLIVHGSLRKIAVYLSTNKTELYTDYELLPATVIAQRQITLSRSPGPQRLVVRQWGGETTIDGIKVSITDENFAPLPTESPLLLLLNHDKQVDKYDVFDGGAGAFVLDKRGRLKNVLVPETAAYKRFNGMELATAIQEIHRLGR